MLSSPSKPRLAFGPFQLDTDKAELRKHGVRVRLARQPWQVLLMLIERPGQVVTREEIRQRLWSDDTFVDFDHGLNATMNRLRQALGDSAEAARYIETVPGEGYRFAAPVHNAPEAEARRPAEPLRSTPATWRSRRSALVGGVATLALMSVAAVAFSTRRLDRPDSGRRTVQFTIAVPSGFGLEPAGSRQAFAVAPNGSRVAFTGLGDDGQFRLWVRDLSELKPREVPNTRGLHSVFWSPDSESLFYSVRGSVRRIPADGTAHQVICELPQVLHLGAWLSPARLLLSNRVATFVAPASGGTATRLPETYVWPQVLPDGEHILHIQFDPRLHRNRLKISRIGAAGPAADVLETDSRVRYAPAREGRGMGYLLHIRGGTLLAHPFDEKRRRVTGEAVPIAGGVHFFPPTGAADFSVSENGTLVYQPHDSESQIQWFDREGRQTGAVGVKGPAVKYGRLSPDARKIAAAIRNAESGSTELWVFDGDTGTGRVVVGGPGIADSPIWSADSRQLLYARALGGAPQLYVRRLGEQDAEEKLPAAPFQLPTDWSQDGRFILFTNTAFPAGANELEGNVSLIDLRTKKVTVLLDSPSQETNAVFGPDGKWISYISNDSGRAEAYVQKFEDANQPRLAGERIRISAHGALYVRWRKDGREVVYLGTDGFLYGVPLENVRGIRTGTPQRLFRVPVASRAVLPSMYGFDVTADGSRFLLPMTQSDAHLVVIENWESLIRRKE